MFILDEIVSYLEMCTEEQTSLQRGMNYRLPSGRTVILMSRRPNAPYADRIEDARRTIVYEGHDLPKSVNLRDRKTVDQIDPFQDRQELIDPSADVVIGLFPA
jgi:hypothetical protein